MLQLGRADNVDYEDQFDISCPYERKTGTALRLSCGRETSGCANR